jgi:hypothetical protein
MLIFFPGKIQVVKKLDPAVEYFGGVDFKQDFVCHFQALVWKKGDKRFGRLDLKAISLMLQFICANKLN